MSDFKGISLFFKFYAEFYVACNVRHIARISQTVQARLRLCSSVSDRRLVSTFAVVQPQHL